jgi:hypothetical protein
VLNRAGRCAVSCALAAAILGGRPAAADSPGPPVVDDPTGTVTTVIRLPGTPGGPPGSPTGSAAGVSLDPCSYRFDPTGMVAEGFDFSRADAPSREQIAAGQVRWYEVSCPGQVGYPVFALVGQPAPGPPPPTPGELAAVAREFMQLPVPAVRHNPADAGLVNLATWLWVDDGTWQVRSYSLSLRGTSVTVVAKPTRVEWKTGDGTLVTCAGQGRAYDVRVPATGQSTYCSHTYARSSADQPGNSYVGSATVSWEISWLGSAPGGAVQQGVVPPLELTSSFDLRVQEVQDLVTQARSAPRAG